MAACFQVFRCDRIATVDLHQYSIEENDVQVTMAPARTRNLEFGIYRNGDNNLDESQTSVLTQARDVSLADRSIQFTVQNTTSALRQAQGDTVTDTYALDGGVKREIDQRPAVDMADPDNLAQFVARTLDNAEKTSAKQTWIDLDRSWCR